MKEYQSPVYKIIAVPVEKVVANNYNPNVVAPPEMKLLELSIWEDGYTMPCVCYYLPDKDQYELVDGYHRYLVLKKSARIYEREKGLLPVAVIEKDISNRMVSTIRHNRARGTHNVELMSHIVAELTKAGMSDQWILKNIGMDKDDAVLAFQRHATSKLYTDDDLFNINSLGFRGEALPSIAAVSEVLLKTSQGEVGTIVHIKGGKILENKNGDARKGTQITVTNMFYNTPARLKHLSSPYAELAGVTEYVNKMALSYPSIKFRLTNDEKELLNTDGSGNLLKVIKSILRTSFK